MDSFVKSHMINCNSLSDQLVICINDQCETGLCGEASNDCICGRVSSIKSRPSSLEPSGEKSVDDVTDDAVERAECS